MRHFRVTGALKEDGSLIEEVVVALSEVHATRKANAAGVAVSGVEMIHADDGDSGHPPLSIDGFDRSRANGVRVPMILSAVSNLLFGVFWAARFPFGLRFISPGWGVTVLEHAFIGFWALAAVEIVFASTITSGASPRRAANWSVAVALAEIVAGLFNWFGLICGALVMVGQFRLRRSS